MQIFEVIELAKFPFMEMKEINEGTTVSDVLNNNNITSNNVFLLVDHDTKRIWTYNEPQSSLKIQVYAGILAGMLRQQLKLFYRVYPLNMYSSNDNQFQEIMNKQLGVGRAKVITEKNFSKSIPVKQISNLDLSNPDMMKAIEYINQFPQPDNLIRKFMIIGGYIYTDEEFTESFLNEEKIITNPIKLGRLNNGFTLFNEQNYSTRLIIKDRKIQGIELYVNQDEISTSLKLQIPIIFEEKYNKPGSIDNLISSFKIPDQLPEENETPSQNDSSNQS
ncbi:MAG: hypothetical protein ACXABO_11130 [Promethearchaeota archaeon]|jgi:hypothetical protein